MEVVSVKVDERTKSKMKRLSHVNWSEVIRRAIQAKILEEEVVERRIDPSDLEEAFRLADSIRRPSPGWSSTEEIRRWRDQRK
ncbi:MAG: hypothetical protein ACUVTD_01915 [Nitrososphaerales archaeon]